MKKSKKVGLYIAGPSFKVAEKLEKAVLRVLNSSAGDEVKIEALKVMANALSPKAEVSNCTFNS